MLQLRRYLQEGLAIVVIGASGDLAKKKTYPSLLYLFAEDLLPNDVVIYGYARSPKTDESFRAGLRQYLDKSMRDGHIVDSFLSRCFYRNGKSYGDVNAYVDLVEDIRSHEDNLPHKLGHNRLFYFAIPPNVFGETAVAVRRTAMAEPRGWTRVIIEKPFGRDLESCDELSLVLSEQFDESHLYRIDHYLGKEMVQNLITLRFGNSWFEWLWHKHAVSSVEINFKEPFGTDGRGGYFDKYGIIRDVIQNHLLQVLTLLAMEPPSSVDGPAASDLIRDEKVKVLNAIPPVQLEDCILGQYEGYANDPTIANKDTNCPTYAAIRLAVNTPRWQNVPFIVTAGKALDERKCDVRIKFREAPNARAMFGSNATGLSKNELVLRLQPGESMSMSMNVKSPGFSSTPVSTDMQAEYASKFDMMSADTNPDAYTRLILDVLQGRQASFVRADELRKSWEIFTPLLHQIERENVRPHLYKSGMARPMQAEAFIAGGGVVACDDRSPPVSSNDTVEIGVGDFLPQGVQQSAL